MNLKERPHAWLLEFEQGITYFFGVIERFMFDVEILYLAKQSGLRLRELPVRWSDATGSKVRFFTGVYQMFRDLVRIRLAHRDFDDTVQ